MTQDKVRGLSEDEKFAFERIITRHEMYPHDRKFLVELLDRLSTPPASPATLSPEELEVLSDLRAWCAHSPETESLVGPSPVRKRVLELVEMFERRFGGAQSDDPSAPQIERVAKALHAFEREHGYIAREWGGTKVEDVYMAMARVVLEVGVSR